MNQSTDLREKIIVALDFDQYTDATAMVSRLPDAVFFKVGLQAYLKFGKKIIRFLEEKQKKLFLDLKFKDIPNTVYGAVKSASRFNANFLTIHLSGGAEMIKQAVAAAQESPGLDILGVTVLTSLSDQDLQETGISLNTREAVLKLVELGLNNQLNSFVCSPLEIEPIRARFGKDIKLVTPGIRPQWAAKGDQKRVFTPKMAMAAGSTYMVVGRPITKNDHPQEAYDKILAEINDFNLVS
jgi:orotidine-5'-phosphate decarboxylase